MLQPEAALIPNATCVRDKHDTNAAELAESMPACEYEVEEMVSRKPFQTPGTRHMHVVALSNQKSSSNANAPPFSGSGFSSPGVSTFFVVLAMTPLFW